jgi:hypothetical protein
MNRFFTAVCIGACAGMVDIMPMVAHKLPASATVSAFIHWVALGIIITYVRMPLSPWLSGVVVSILSSLPIAVLVGTSTMKSAAPILIMATVLGSVVGMATARYAVAHR